jgi:hypothetical protein
MSVMSGGTLSALEMSVRDTGATLVSDIMVCIDSWADYLSTTMITLRHGSKVVVLFNGGEQAPAKAWSAWDRICW